MRGRSQTRTAGDGPLHLVHEWEEEEELMPRSLQATFHTWHSTTEYLIGCEISKFKQVVCWTPQWNNKGNYRRNKNKCETERLRHPFTKIEKIRNTGYRVHHSDLFCYLITFSFKYSYSIIKVFFKYIHLIKYKYWVLVLKCCMIYNQSCRHWPGGHTPGHRWGSSGQCTGNADGKCFYILSSFRKCLFLTLF